MKYFICGQYDGWGTSWYLFASFYGMIVVVWLRCYFSDKALFSIGVIIEVFYVIRFSVLNITPVWYDFTFLRSILYIMIGLILAKNSDRILIKLRQYSLLVLTIITGIFVLIFLIEAYGLYYYFGISRTAEVAPLTAIVSTIVFVWSLLIPWRIPYSAIVRKLSTFIYCLHILFIRIIFVILHLNRMPALFEWSLTIILCCICFVGYCYLEKRWDNKWLKNLT